jgi:hypothetical protein
MPHLSKNPPPPDCKIYPIKRENKRQAEILNLFFDVLEVPIPTIERRIKITKL